MKSHAILRTNTGLTTNVKIVVRSNYELYLDCIDSAPELNDNRYRKFRFTKDNFLDEIVPKFFRNTPNSLAFKVKYDNDNNVVYKDFDKQYDDLYYYGARNIYDNKDYEEEFEYFAPLHISKTSIPTHFIIFRVDGTGLIELNSANFRDEILSKMKVVKFFDLTPNTELGELLKKNITDNNSFPSTSLDINFNRMEFSYFVGIDYETGGYTKRSQMLEYVFSKELPLYEMEKFIYDGYKNNNIIYPHLLNFSFLFDDTPATPTSLRKWSINRYLGFYMNSLVSVTKVSPNDLPILKNNVIIYSGNILQTNDGQTPFQNESGLSNFPYVELNGKFYFVQKYVEYQDGKRSKVQTSNNTFVDKVAKIPINRYKILSDVSLEGLQSNLNKNLVYIQTVNSKTVIYEQDRTTPFVLSDYNTADVWLIKIGDLYHKLFKNQDNILEIVTDYGFEQSSNRLDYYINESDPTYRKSLNLTISEYQGPVEFEIFKCEMTDIKDWDTDIVETNFAKYEYEETETLTETDEPKLILTNLNSSSDPKDYDDYIISNKVVNIPVSSEYTGNHETFRLVENDLNGLWRKNSERVKWGFQNSISNQDYPYLLNNSIYLDDFNSTVNPYTTDVQRNERVLDYFYSINPSTTSYSHHTLHVQPLSGKNINTSYVFDVGKYVLTNLDYFTYFFGQKTDFEEGKILKNTQKWSYFNPSDGLDTNNTLFRGLKFKIYDVGGISVGGSGVENINLKLTNTFDDYKFSILFSENKSRVIMDPSNLNKGITQSFKNNMRWAIIDQWKMDKTYKGSEFVLWNDYLFSSVKENTITDPKKNPFSESWLIAPGLNPSLTDWTNVGIEPLYERQVDLVRTIFYDPSKLAYVSAEYVLDPLIHPVGYREGSYFYLVNLGSYPVPFWYPKVSYPPLLRTDGTKVFFKDKIWEVNPDLTSNVSYLQLPGGNDKEVLINRVNGIDIPSYLPYWVESTGTSDWKKVPLWEPTKNYGQPLSGFYALTNHIFDLTVYQGVLYGMTADSSTNIISAGDLTPDLNPRWSRLYSLEPDTNYEYGDSLKRNNVIELNNRYYLYLNDTTTTPPSVDEVLDKTLDNGITIYIHKKFKNILINITVNDNTYKKYTMKKIDSVSYKVDFQIDFMKNIDRDSLYNDLFTKLTANNFMNALNDVNNKYGFTDPIRYVIIEETGELKVYDFNNLESVKKLPYFISCQGPDEFFVQNKSIRKQSINVDENLLKPKFKLENGAIRTSDQLNYFGDVPIANTVDIEKIEQNPIPNFSSLKNNLYTVLYRHSGFYSPIFKNIDLFTSFTNTENLGNFKFDTTLTEFGMTSERIVSKVNRKEELLKLNKISSLKSIYPMMDEFGYHIVKTFIFKSTWDFKFHYECKSPILTDNVSNKTIQKVEKKSDNNLI